MYKHILHPFPLGFHTRKTYENALKMDGALYVGNLSKRYSK
jgi:hypothetical protein